MSIIRVFATKTRDCPGDDHAFFGPPTLFLPKGAAEVHVSCTFTWARERAEQLARQWEAVGLPVKAGGVAYGGKGGEFTPGMYLREGITITSRGCPNRCWFCSVWRRDGDLRELPIRDGWKVYDDNLLACSDGHIRAVFGMLKRQPEKAQFKGGLEAARLKPWHVELIREIKPSAMYFAYDTPDDREPLHDAGVLLKAAYANPQNRAGCYVLCGYKGDTIAAAEKRMMETWSFGFLPFAMLYRDGKTEPGHEWKAFQRLYVRPAITRSIVMGKTGRGAL